MFRSIAITLALCLATATAQAALLSRVGGQAYYDDVLNITWLADANLASGNTFGVDGINEDGGMTWELASAWIGAMSSTGYLGVNSWRLPFIVDTGAPGCDGGNSGTDCGFNVQTMSATTVYNEMAHLYYVTLGNLGQVDTNGVSNNCSNASPFCLTNTGPFSNIQPGDYWTGTAYAPADYFSWAFVIYYGGQGYKPTYDSYTYAWAVTDGDPFSVVPVPPAVWLFGSALTLMGWMRRKVS